MTKTTTMATPPRSRLLLLPAELHNTIYELVFTPAHDANTLIDIRTAEPPSKALLLSCRQLNTEAHGLHLQAYRTYWTTTSFTLDLRTLDLGPSDLRQIRGMTRDLAHVQKMEVINRGNFGQGDIFRKCSLVETARVGIWYMKFDGGSLDGRDLDSWVIVADRLTTTSSCSGGMISDNASQRRTQGSTEARLSQRQ